MSSAAVSTATIRVTNTGTLPATWSLSASTATAGSPWEITDGALALNAFRLSAGFHGTRPAPAAFGAEDRLTPGGASSTNAAFSIDGSSTGAGVPPSESRDLWLLLETPPVTTTVQEQHFQITVIAHDPDHFRIGNETRRRKEHGRIAVLGTNPMFMNGIETAPSGEGPGRELTAGKGVTP